MYAVIKTGGKQYRVSRRRKNQGRTDSCRSRQRNRPRPGADGRRWRQGHDRARRSWPAQRSRPRCVSHGRGDKVHIFKMRRRKHYRKRQGHRQNYTEIEISASTGYSVHYRRHAGTMAHKKAGGSSRNGRDSQSKRLGVKALRRRSDSRRQHHRAPARHPGASRRQCRHRQGPHAVRKGDRPRRVRAQRAGQATRRSASSPAVSQDLAPIDKPCHATGLFCLQLAARTMKFIDEATIESPRRQGRGRLAPASGARSSSRAAGPTAATAGAAAAFTRSPTATSTRWSTTALRASTARGTAKTGADRTATANRREDIVLRVPVGTVVSDIESGDAGRRPRNATARRALLAKGGAGRHRQHALQIEHQSRAAPVHARRAGRDRAAEARAEGAGRRRPARACRTRASRPYIRARLGGAPEGRRLPFHHAASQSGRGARGREPQLRASRTFPA